MARQTTNGEINRSQAIRDLLAQNPKMSTADIMDSLAQRGIKVSNNLVYITKNKMHRRRRKQMRAQVAEVVAPTPKSPLEVIMKVKGLASEVGGIKKLKQLIDVLSE